MIMIEQERYADFNRQHQNFLSESLQVLIACSWLKVIQESYSVILWLYI